jgi:alpha-amylase
LILHSHQPVGQHPWVLERIYDESYLPMVEALEAHPAVRLSLHYTGCLLDWIKPNRPEFLERLEALVARGQVELMTGGYYEPILVAIPESDAIAQIDRLTHFLKSNLGVSPRGMWLAERVWEPQLPSVLARAGVDWTVLDDTHFRLSGIPSEELRGYFVTEDRGDQVKLVATSKPLREMIPWAEVDAVIEYLRSRAADDDPLLVMGDDGEKFGSWPGTFDHVWRGGWIQRFFNGLSANSDWLSTVPTGEYIAEHRSRGRVYIPAASYEEMMEWALPADVSFRLGRLRKRLASEGDEGRIGDFLGGGLWRNFLARYSEVNVLHKKVLRVHHKLAAAEKAYQRGQQLTGTSPAAPLGAVSARGWSEMPRVALERGFSQREASPLAAAWEHLWAAECNCPYWHGVFGGVYLRDIRHALFAHAVQAETIADSLTRKGEWFEAVSVDHDRDGDEELLIESESANVYVAPASGGAIFEWDIKCPPLNLATALRRRPEAYHQTVREAARAATDSNAVRSIHDAVTLLDEDLEEVLVYDWHERWCLIEHLLEPTLTIEEFAAGRYEDRGNFALEAFSWERPAPRAIALEREGVVNTASGQARLKLRKLLESSSDGSVAVTYVLTHIDGPPVSYNFGSEWNLSPLLFGADYAPVVTANSARLDWSPSEPLEISQLAQFSSSSAALGLKLDVESNPAAALWSVPIEAASASEKGLERTYQGHCLYFQWPLSLAEGESARFRLIWRPEGNVTPAE